MPLIHVKFGLHSSTRWERLCEPGTGTPDGASRNWAARRNSEHRLADAREFFPPSELIPEPQAKQPA
jgi:hypothetical protein